MGTAAVSSLTQNLYMKKLSWAFKSHLSKAEYCSADLTRSRSNKPGNQIN